MQIRVGPLWGSAMRSMTMPRSGLCPPLSRIQRMMALQACAAGAAWHGKDNECADTHVAVGRGCAMQVQRTCAATAGAGRRLRKRCPNMCTRLHGCWHHLKKPSPLNCTALSNPYRSAGISLEGLVLGVVCVHQHPGVGMRHVVEAQLDARHHAQDGGCVGVPGRSRVRSALASQNASMHCCRWAWMDAPHAACRAWAASRGVHAV